MKMELQAMPKGTPPHRTAIKMTGFRTFKIADIAHRVGDIQGEIYISTSYLLKNGIPKSIEIDFDEMDKRGL